MFEGRERMSAVVSALAFSCWVRAGLRLEGLLNRSLRVAICTPLSRIEGVQKASTGCHNN
jgi:hypothetical protein